jgi:hypothetical protein
MTNNHLEEQCNTFFKKMAKLTKLPVPTVKKILKKRDIVTFNPKHKSEYKATILADAGMYKRIETAMSSTPKPVPCPIPDCKGHKQSTRDSHWACTVGGIRHYWAEFVAHATKEPIEDVLVTLTDMKMEQEQRDEDARQEWYRRMREDEDTTTQKATGK